MIEWQFTNADLTANKLAGFRASAASVLALYTVVTTDYHIIAPDGFISCEQEGAGRKNCQRQ